MTLNSYLKQFDNICWYPSANKDFLSLISLSFSNLRFSGFSKEECPDCFIFTDYDLPRLNDRYLFDSRDELEEIWFDYDDYSITLQNIKELKRLNIDFDQEMVAFARNNDYGRVFIADVLIDHPIIGRVITKLVYIDTENTKFAFEFLLKNHIQVKYLVRVCYGNGFGGGISSGGFLFNILKELNTKYFINDITNPDIKDVADKYLSNEQLLRSTTLKSITDFTEANNWIGDNHVLLYRVKEIIQNDIGFFIPRFILERN